MKDYSNMDKLTLAQELDSLRADYAKYLAMGLKLDMSRGKPSKEQLDLSMGLLSITDYKGDTGVDARNYGSLEGMPEARSFFGELLGVEADEVLVGGNSSLNLEYYLVELGCRSGFVDSDTNWSSTKMKFLCPAPGYDRHFRIAQYFGFELITIPMTQTGPDMDEVEKYALDPCVKGIWCVPVYSNPDGYTYSDDTVKRLAAMQTGAKDFKIFWDNAYCVHHLKDKHDACLNILSECRKANNEDRPFLFCSTSKITFSGAGVGALACSKHNLKYILDQMFTMLISFDKLNQLRHVRFLKNAQGVAEHMEKHRAIIEPKFEMVLKILSERLGNNGDIAKWTNPNGGYFLSLYTQNNCAKRTVQLCKEAGVILTGAGAAYPYGIDPSDSNIRIAPTFPPIEELKTATYLLCLAVQISTVEKLLQAE
ncbi:MAG: aminotransferase class I/II-fold pyridoxal phosphate-dependent enzyme [Oscillospiraceae bacterium]